MRISSLFENLAAIGGDGANFPRRYFANGEGHRVIIGLTVDETSEFEALDARHVADCDPLRHVSSGSLRPMSPKRWLELYAKHVAAWDEWMKKSSIDQGK
jgi:hypothetical protein